MLRVRIHVKGCIGEPLQFFRLGSRTSSLSLPPLNSASIANLDGTAISRLFRHSAPTWIRLRFPAIA